MIILAGGATDQLELVTDAAGDIEAHVTWVDKATGSPPYDIDGDSDALASITSATTTVLVEGASSVERSVRHLSLFNNHASQAVTCTVQHNDGTDVAVLKEVVLAANETLVLDAAGVWSHCDANGGPYVGLGPMATQAEMEAGTSTTAVVTPGRLHFHPGVAKAWGKAVGAGTSLTVNYNISGISDTGTGRLGVTIGTDFSSANYAIGAMVERSVTALTATGVEDQTIRNASPAAGSFEIESYDQTAITFAAQDPTSYFWECFGDQ